MKPVNMAEVTTVSNPFIANFTNNTNDSIELNTRALLDDPQQKYKLDENTDAIVIPLIFSLIFITGLIGNTCVIASVLRYKSMRSAPNLFIVNLAFGDILMILIAIPTAAIKYTIRSWPFGNFVCKLSYFIQTLSIGLSIFTLTALSIDRVLVISQLLRNSKVTSSHRIIAMLTAVWLLSILIALPDALLYEQFTFNGSAETRSFCIPSFQAKRQIEYYKFYSTPRFIVFFVIPLITIGICYGVMARIMMKSSHSLPGEAGASMWIQRLRNRRKRVAYTVIVLIILFFLCWLPSNLLILVITYTSVTMTPALHYAKVVFYCLKYINSCINPITLFFLSKSFRSRYMAQLCCTRRSGYHADTDAHTPLSAGRRSLQLIKLNSNSMHNADINNHTQSTDIFQT